MGWTTIRSQVTLGGIEDRLLGGGIGSKVEVNRTGVSGTSLLGTHEGIVAFELDLLGSISTRTRVLVWFSARPALY